MNTQALFAILSRFQKNEGLPKGREKVEDALTHVLFQAVEAYMVDDGPIGTALRDLGKAAANRKDPIWKSQGVMIREVVSNALSQLAMMREEVQRVRSQVSLAPEVVSDSQG